MNANHTNIEKVAEKIAKLLKLAEGQANEAESQAAWVKAQELASQYQLDLEALRQKGEAPAAEMVEDVLGKVNSAWAKSVVIALCAVNGCIPMTQGTQMFVLGEKGDVSLIKTLFAAIRRQVEHLSHVEAKAQRTEQIKGWGHAYRTGMALRVSQRIREAAVRVQESGTALVLARDSRTRDFMQQTHPNARSRSISPQARHGEAVGLGYQHGDRVQLHKAVAAA